MTSSIYHRLSSISFLSKSYTLKFLFVAFLGIHLPLIGLFALLLVNPEHFSPLNAMLVALAFTLLGTGITLFILNGLLSPLKLASQALIQYVTNRTLPNLPTFYTDEAGTLLNNLQQTITKLENLLKQRQDLTSLLSHDLRSPMNNALGICEILRLEEDKETVQVIIDQLEKEMKHQLVFLGEVLDMMRHDDVNLPYHKLKPTSAQQVVLNAVEQLRVPIQQKKINVEVDIDHKAGIKIFPTLFQQAIQNLLTNAIKFSEREGKIEVKGKVENNMVLLEIKDYGMGFDPADATQIFKRFTDKGKAGTQGESSTGLGLYLSKDIIEKHQGTITASSPGKGKGAIFTISIPLAKNFVPAAQEPTTQVLK
jgi:signal transduction histidine kinase